MKTDKFQELLFKSAIFAIACDGSIDESEISEIRKMAENEIYFMGFDFQKQLEITLNSININSSAALNGFMNEISSANLNDNQELLLIEVLIRAVESDHTIKASEINFLKMVKSKLKTSEETIIANFPNQIDYFINYKSNIDNEDFLAKKDFS